MSLDNQKTRQEAIYIGHVQKVRFFAVMHGPRNVLYKRGGGGG